MQHIVNIIIIVNVNIANIVIIDYMLFHNVTCYTKSLLSCIHVNSANLLNITYNVVATCMILGSLDCIV